MDFPPTIVYLGYIPKALQLQFTVYLRLYEHDWTKSFDLYPEIYKYHFGLLAKYGEYRLIMYVRSFGLRTDIMSTAARHGRLPLVEKLSKTFLPVDEYGDWVSESYVQSLAFYWPEVTAFLVNNYEGIITKHRQSRAIEIAAVSGNLRLCKKVAQTISEMDWTFDLLTNTSVTVLKYLFEVFSESLELSSRINDILMSRTQDTDEFVRWIISLNTPLTPQNYRVILSNPNISESVILELIPYRTDDIITMRAAYHSTWEQVKTRYSFLIRLGFRVPNHKYISLQSLSYDEYEKFLGDSDISEILIDSIQSQHYYSAHRVLQHLANLGKPWSIYFELQGTRDDDTILLRKMEESCWAPSPEHMEKWARSGSYIARFLRGEI